MKIRKNPPQPVPSSKPRRAGGKAALPGVRKHTEHRRSLLPSPGKTLINLRLETTGRALALLSGRIRPGLGKALPPLREFLSLLKEYAPSPGSADLRLAGSFLKGWLDRYGNALTEEARKELFLLLRTLEEEIRESTPLSPVLYSAQGRGESPPLSPSWSLCVRDEDKKDSKGDGRAVHCLLDITFPRLGLVRSFLKYDETSGVCNFFSHRREIRGIIREALPGLRERLKGAGFRHIRAGIGKRAAFPPAGGTPPSWGVNLWG